MNEILNKISSYNIFNYLLPGAVFAVLAEKFTHYSILQENIFTAVFTYYFIGLVISRIGSIMIEPLLKRWKVISFAEYSDFVLASKEDSKLEVLSEVNNMYRTFISFFVLLLSVVIYSKITELYPAVQNITPYLLMAGVLILFVFSYRKQTNYITDRVNTLRNNK